jgi:Bacterial Ig domain
MNGQWMVVLAVVGLGCAPDMQTEEAVSSRQGALMATRGWSTLVPECSTPTADCNSGNLLSGRGSFESGGPNTIFDSCPDGTATGSLFATDSIESLQVTTLDGTPMAANKTVRLTVRAWVSEFWNTNTIDIYTTNGLAPVTWTYRTRLYPDFGTAGIRTLTTDFNLLDMDTQAVRAVLTRGASTSVACRSTGSQVNDHDDLVFAVNMVAADTTAPTVTLTSPLPGTAPQALSLTATAVDNISVSRVDFYGDGALVGSDTTAPYSFVWNTSVGAHTAFARAVDPSNNVGTSATVSVVVNSAPQVWFISPAPNSLFNGTYSVQVGASDDVAVTRVEFLNGTVQLANDTSAPWGASFSVPGVHTLIARAWDAAGNSTDATLVVRNDTSAPQGVILSPAANTTVFGTRLVTLNVLDDVGVDHVELFVNDTLVGSSSAAPWSISWDTTTLHSNGPAVAASLKLRVVDLVARSTETAPIVVSVYNDSTPPAVSVGSPSEGQVVEGQTAISIVASDDSGSALCELLLDGVVVLGSCSLNGTTFWLTTGTSNGPHLLSVRVTDAQGNATTVNRSIVVSNDVTAPTVAVDSPLASSTVNGTVTITASAADDRAVTRVDFTVDGSLIATRTTAPWSTQWNSRSLANGTHVLRARAYDAANQQTLSTGVVIVVDNDVQAPAVAISSPASNAVVSGTVSIVASASDNFGVTRVDLQLGSTVVQSLTAPPYIFSWNSTSQLDGFKSFYIIAYDAAGNSAAAFLQVNVQNGNAPPTLILTSPSAGSTLSSVVNLSANATDADGIARVEFLVDGAIVNTDITSPYAFAFDTATLSNGSHTMGARAFDTASLNTLAQVAVIIANGVLQPQVAVWNSTLKVPACAGPATGCDSGTLLKGRGLLGPEANAPNTLDASCVESSSGGYGSDETLESIAVVTQDGSPLATGKTVTVTVKVIAFGSGDVLDVYSAPTVTNPVWTLRSTLAVNTRGANTLTTTFTLPAGSQQVIRGSFRYGGTSTPCPAGPYNDHDDLVFAVAP